MVETKFRWFGYVEKKTCELCCKESRSDKT